MDGPIDADGLASKALRALLKQCAADPALSRDAHVQLVINTKKPMGTKNDYVPRIIPLQHSKLQKPASLRILLVVKDPSTPYRTALKADSATSELFADIISVKRLKTKYRGAKLNELFRQFDMVVADHRVQHLLPHILGSAFYRSNKKVPFVVQLSKQPQPARAGKPDGVDPKYVRAQLRSICRNTWYLPTPDNCLTVRIGVVGAHQPEEMLQNIEDVVQFLCDKTKRPQGGAIRGGIKSLFVKTSNSVSLPIYKASEKPVESEDQPRL
ncbi:AaceriACR252Cp [[Ashbya] aceris (nom. inval.)]|nr:AaceriACR252Cp [[Ashbya] aceris (nom. inval.)]